MVAWPSTLQHVTGPLEVPHFKMLMGKTSTQGEPPVQSLLLQQVG